MLSVRKREKGCEPHCLKAWPKKIMETDLIKMKIVKIGYISLPRSVSNLYRK